MISLDGSEGEGGGQILRTALSLSIITGKSFELTRIRAGRSNPGLQKQHLASVEAARAISQAKVEGFKQGSQHLLFTPSCTPLIGCEYVFDIGSAGSCTLVFQTILLPLVLAKMGSSEVITTKIDLHGGTHNSFAPPYEFIKDVYIPFLLRSFQVENADAITINLRKYGFYPRGGGHISVTINHHMFARSNFFIPEDLTGQNDKNIFLNILYSRFSDARISKQVKFVNEFFPSFKIQAEKQEFPENQGRTNVIMISVKKLKNKSFFNELFSSVLDKKDDDLLEMTRILCSEVEDFMASESIVGEDFSDQLVLLMSLSKNGGNFQIKQISSHLKTNMEIIRKFLPLVEFEVDKAPNDSQMFSVTCTVK